MISNRKLMSDVRCCLENGNNLEDITIFEDMVFVDRMDSSHLMTEDRNVGCDSEMWGEIGISLSLSSITNQDLGNNVGNHESEEVMSIVSSSSKNDKMKLKSSDDELKNERDDRETEFSKMDGISMTITEEDRNNSKIEEKRDVESGCEHSHRDVKVDEDLQFGPKLKQESKIV